MVNYSDNNINNKRSKEELMGTINLTTSLVMIALFAVAIIGFAINYAVDNSSVININEDPEIVGIYGTAEGNLSGFSKDSESQYKSLLETTIEPQSGSVGSTAPFASTVPSAIGASKNIIKVGYIKIFGTGSGFGLFVGTLMALIAFMFGLYIYKTLRGQPD